MNNLKTAFIVVLLLGALYGAYQFLNHRDVPPPPEAQLQFDQGIAPPTIEFGTPGGDFGVSPVSVPTTSGSETSPASAPQEFAPPPSFTVTPPPSDPKFDALPAAAPSNNATATTTESPTARDSAPPIARSAYSEPDAQPTTGEPTQQPPKADRSSLQENPWYRPQHDAAASAPVGASLSPEAATKANRQAFQRSWLSARDLVESGKFAQALAELTTYYDHPDLTTVEKQQLQKTLDSLAGRVIYSTEHYLAEPHVVRSGETLMDVAAQYNVQWQLLQNINGIRDPNVLVPKTQLKVVRGPFRAEVSLQTSHLTLYVDKYYAGRFPVSLGTDPLPAPGNYTVREKRDGKPYIPANGRTVAAGHPSNPYGGQWIDLGNEICIHGSAADPKISLDYGCVSLSPQDANDVAGILTIGSTVVIRR